MNQSLNLESPLESLVNKPMDQMSDQELREHVQRLNELATSSQALQAELRGRQIEEKSGGKVDSLGEF